MTHHRKTNNAIYLVVFLIIAVAINTLWRHANLTHPNDRSLEELDNTNELDVGVRYIFALGTEATGHHATNAVLGSSPMQQRMLDSELHEYQRDACGALWQFVLNDCTTTTSTTTKKSNEEAYNELVTKLRQFDEKIQQYKSWLNTVGSTGGDIINIHVNIANECTVSYPAYLDQECRDQQYVSLHVFYKACDDAGIMCGHIILLRNALDVWKSTARRGFDEPHRLVHTLATKLDSIASQMMSHRTSSAAAAAARDDDDHHHRRHHGNLIACLDYDDPMKTLATTMSGEQNLLGWNIPDGSLMNMLGEYYDPSYSSKHTADGIIFNKDLVFYIEQMHVTTKRIRKLCAAQLLGVKQKRAL